MWFLKASVVVILLYSPTALSAQSDGWYLALGVGSSDSRRVLTFGVGASLNPLLDLGISGSFIEGQPECLNANGQCAYGGWVGQVGGTLSPIHLGPVYPFVGLDMGRYWLPGRAGRHEDGWSPEIGLGAVVGSRGTLRFSAFRFIGFSSGVRYFNGVRITAQAIVARFDE